MWIEIIITRNQFSLDSRHLSCENEKSIDLQQHTLVLMLPQPELPTLGGDPIEYYNIRSFENLIEARTDKALISNIIYNWRCSRINDWLFINESRSRLLQGRKAIKTGLLETIQNSKCYLL